MSLSPRITRPSLTSIKQKTAIVKKTSCSTQVRKIGEITADGSDWSPLPRSISEDGNNDLCIPHGSGGDDRGRGAAAEGRGSCRGRGRGIGGVAHDAMPSRIRAEIDNAHVQDIYFPSN